MTIAELKARKKELGYTNEMVAELSGVPLSTVQKVFGGTTAHPRRETLKALEELLAPGEKLLAPGEERLTAGKKSGCPEAAYESIGRFRVSETEKRSQCAGHYTISRPPKQDYKLQETNLAYLVGNENDSDTVRKPGEYTIEDYYRVPDDLRVELIDGRMYMKAAPTTRHQYIAVAVITQIMSWQMAHGTSCLALVSPVDVQLDEDDRTMVQPDLVAVCDRSMLQEEIIFGAPDLVMEIISPSSGGKDRILKFNKYWCAGVKEYWIIDPQEERVIVYRFAAGQPPETYTFDDQVPVGLTGGELRIDFKMISDYGKQFFDA